MKKLIFSIIMLTATALSTETWCKNKKKSAAPTQAATKATKKAKSGTLSTQEYDYWYGRAEGLARMYEQENQAKFPNTGDQYDQQLESIRALKGAIQELNLTNKNKVWADQAQELAQEYMSRHEDEDLTEAKAIQKIINVLKQIKKDWKTEFAMAQEGPEAASL